MQKGATGQVCVAKASGRRKTKTNKQPWKNLESKVPSRPSPASGLQETECPGTQRSLGPAAGPPAPLFQRPERQPESRGKLQTRLQTRLQTSLPRALCFLRRLGPAPTWPSLGPGACGSFFARGRGCRAASVAGVRGHNSPGQPQSCSSRCCRGSDYRLESVPQTEFAAPHGVKLKTSPHARHFIANLSKGQPVLKS